MMLTMSTIIIGAGLGALIRWQLGATAMGLLLVNVLGSLIAGFFARSEWVGHPAVVLGITVGFCGALTTFSGFSVATIRGFEQGDFFKTALFILLNNALCLSLCYAGWFVAKRLKS